MRTIPRIPLLIESSSGYGRGLLRGIARYRDAHGPWIMEPWGPFHIVAGTWVSPLPKLHAGEFDGIISRDWDDITEILALNLPVVFCPDRHPPPRRGVSVVITHDEAIGAMAAEYFLNKGYRSFGYLGFDFLFWSENRRVSFIDHLRRAGHAVDVFQQQSAKDSHLWDYEKPEIAEWLQSLPKPVAVFTCNDERALQAAASCRLAALQIPDDVAILGVDDDEFMCQFWHPSVSSIHLNLEKAGYEAAALLEQLMNGKRGQNETIYIEPIHVVTRVSTDTLAVNDPNVAAAVRFIRDNAHQKIEVNDVARVAGVSRRALYQRFKDQLGHTIYDEITAARIAKIERLLIETRFTVSDIAELAGFSTPEHLSQFFRKHRGIRPTEFRKRHVPR